MNNNYIMAEQAVLGCLISDEDVSGKISFLQAKHFNTTTHRKVFEAIEGMIEKGIEVSLISLDNYMGDDVEDVGGFSYLVELCKNAPGRNSVVPYADIIVDSFQRKEITTLMVECTERLKNTKESLVDVLSVLSEKVDSLISSASKSDVLTIDELIDKSLDEMESSNAGVRRGIKTGIPELDDRLGYRDMASGEVTVVTALSKNGKTLLANTIVSRCELVENEVGHVFSVEMTDVDMFNAMVSARTGVPANFYCKQDFYSERYPNEYPTMMARWGAAANQLRDEARLTIDGQKDVNIDYLITSIKKQYMLARNKGKTLKFVMIDHLHRMEFDDSKQNRTYAIHSAVKRLKNIASELDISILLLAQQSREAVNKDPSSHFIEDSAKVRQELQCCIGVKMYRDNGGTYFGLFTDAHRYADSETIFEPVYMKLINGVLRSLPEGETHWKPKQDEAKTGNKW